MSQANIDKAKKAKKYFQSAEDAGRQAKELLEEIGDQSGKKLAEEVEKSSSNGKRYAERRTEGR